MSPHPSSESSPKSADVISISANNSALKLAEDVLDWVKKGEVIDIAVVLVYSGGGVSDAWSNGNSYHKLNSGATRLSARLANDH